MIKLKRWEVTAELYWDASKHDSVVVEAKTERKARELAYEKLKKKHDKISENMIIIQTVKLLDE